jgi:hypothetical protein
MKPLLSRQSSISACERMRVGKCVRGCGHEYMVALVYLRARSLNYPARKRMRPALTCGLSGSTINGTVLGIKLLDTKRVFRLLLEILFKTFLILRRIQRDIIIYVEKSSGILVVF